MRTASETSDSNKFEAEVPGVKLVTVLYSTGRDLYRVPSMSKGVWLSVQRFTGPMPSAGQLPAGSFLGGMPTADGHHWRKAYPVAWKMILAGATATLPADDPLVMDYSLAEASPGAGAS